MSKTIESWCGTLHPDCQWSPELQPIAGAADRPAVSFAPALILRKRAQAGMVRVYDAIIRQMNSASAEAPAGWSSLTDDDHDDTDAGADADRAARQQHGGSQEVFFPLPANRQQRRIVEALERRRGVLVQGPPGTGKSHTIANLICHLLATGKRVLITAETDRALRVLKGKLPTEMQPLCVSLLGQGGDALAQLNSAVQEIATRFASWSPGAYDDRIAEIDHEISNKRRSMAEIDTELLSLRRDEISPYMLLAGSYQGTASEIAERVAAERACYHWLGLPRDAGEAPPLTADDLLRWLRIRRIYDDEQIARSTLRIIETDKLLPPEVFGAAVVAEREAERVRREGSEHRNHPAYRRIAELRPDVRGDLQLLLRSLNDRRRRLHPRSHGWVAEALSAGLQSRQAGWRELHSQSVAHIGRIEQLLDDPQSASVSIPPEFGLSRVRADADALASHVRDGGKGPPRNNRIGLVRRTHE